MRQGRISTINGVTEKITFENAKGSIVEIGYEVRALRMDQSALREESTTRSQPTPRPARHTGLSGNAPYDGSHTGLFISYEY